MRLYGRPSRAKPSFATNCLLARRLVERGVRFVQLYHTDWDHHGGKGTDLEDLARATLPRDRQGGNRLILDLERRGLLDETLVIWEAIRSDAPSAKSGPRSAGTTMWTATRCGWRGRAETGLRPRRSRTTSASARDERKSPEVHDLHATILHLLGLDHERLTWQYQGLDARLTGVEPAHVVREILA